MNQTGSKTTPLVLLNKPSIANRLPQLPAGAPAPHPKHALEKKRALAIKSLSFSVLLMGFLVMGLLSIYWGTFYHRNLHLRNVHLWIFNLEDSSFSAGYGTVNVEVRDPDNYGRDYETVANQVIHEHTWATFFIRSNASSSLHDALTSPYSAGHLYNGREAVTFMYAEARDQSAYGSITSWVSDLSAEFTAGFTEATLQNAAVNYSISSILNSAPSVLALPATIGFDNLRPFDNPVAAAATQVGLIYLIIVSSSSIFSSLSTCSSLKIKASSFVAYRISQFFLSLFYSLISCLPTGLYQKVQSWRIRSKKKNWLGMIAVGGALENMVLIALATYPPILGFCLVFMVIINVSTAFYSIPLLAHFYRFGYAFPIKNLADASKTIIFNMRNTMGRNIGVVVAWIAPNVVLSPLCVWFFSMQMQRRKPKLRLRFRPRRTDCSVTFEQRASRHYSL
ncbi:hypothetical protein V1522DRAFT_443412 [Lipomyces starkeyi]